MTLRVTAAQLIAIAALVFAVCAPVHAGWKNLGKHPTAVKQDTSRGRTLIELERVGRQIYVGYGDYTANTGPISIYTFDIPKNRFRFDGLTMNTEAIHKFRETSSAGLIALGTDPRGSGRHQFAFRTNKWRTSSGLDTQAASTRGEHVYDVVQWRGALWAAGATLGRKGGLWRSTDKGRNWKIFHIVGSSLPAQDALTRLYFVGVHASELYIQGVDSCSGASCAHPNSLVYDGNSWRRGPDLLQHSGTGAPTDKFAGHMLVRTNETPATTGYLHALRGSIVKKPLGSAPIRDYAIGRDRYLYALISDPDRSDDRIDQLVIRSKDLKEWECLYRAPAGARSIEVYENAAKNSFVYIGMMNSSIRMRAVSEQGKCPMRHAVYHMAPQGALGR